MDLPSFLIRAIVGVMGMDLPDVGPVVVGNIPLEATLRLTVFSVLTRCLLLGVPPPPPAMEGVAAGSVAAVQVSVTGQSSDFTLVTPILEVR